VPGADAAAILPLAPFRGDLDWPAQGRVATPFGRRRDARFRTALTSNGVVIAASAGALVRAIHDGTVAFAEPFPGFGHLVVLDHGRNAYSLYGHLRGAEVAPGTRVARGQEVGRAGTEIDGAPALYFELRIDGKPVDPLQWLRTR
jgi:septal ring factor EnvC (AmiA/AmiB activator)